MGVGASGATLEIQLVADVARLKRDMAAMQETIGSATASAGKSFAGMSQQTVNAAAQMAAAAQASARAAVGMGAGLKSAGMSAANARIVTLEMFHVTRSLTEQLATGVNPARAFAMEIGRIATAVQYSGGSVKGLIRQFAEWAGIITVTRNAELAEAAAQKAATAEAIKSRVERAAATLQAREVDVALAQAQLAAAASADAEAAAQARLVKALRAVEVAAGKATIANEALATAQAEAGAAAAASNAKTVISLSARGAGLAGALTGVAIAAGTAFAAFKVFQSQVRDSGVLDRYANSLGLTKKEMKELRKEVGDLSSKEMQDLDARMRAFEITWGDVFNGLKKTASDALDLSPAWNKFKTDAADAFSSALRSAVTAAAALYGVWNATIDALHSKINNWEQSLRDFYSSHGADISGLPPIQKNSATDFWDNVGKHAAEAQKQISKNLETIRANIIGAAEERIRKAAAAIIEDRTPKKPKKKSDHGLAQALAELDAQIRGQLRLAEAYQISDAAAIKAEALQKAEEQAIRHKGEVGVFYEKELALAVAQRMADGAKQIADIHAEAGARAVVNDLVEQGAVDYRHMGEALEEQTKKRQLMAALAVAEDNKWLEQAAALRAEIANLAFTQADLNKEIERSNALAELGRFNEQHKETMALLEKESQLTGVQKDKRDEILKLLKLEKDLRAQFPGMTEQEIQKVVQETAAEDTLRKHIDQVEAGMDQLRQTGEDMIDTVFNIDNWKDPLDLALQLVKQLEQSFVTLAFANPLKNMLYGENLPTLDSVGGIGGFFKGLVGGGKSAQAMLSTAGTTLNTAGTSLNTAAVALQTAATALSTAAAASGVSSGAGGLLGLLGGAGGGGGFLAGGVGADLGGIGGDASLLYDSSLLGLASGGAFKVGGRGGIDRNVLSINGQPRARVSGDEIIAVIPRDQFGGGANLPGMKHGGFLGGLLGGGLFGGLAGLLLGVNPLLTAGIAGGLFGLGNKIGGPFGDVLRFAGSPALFLGEAIYHHRDDILKYLTPGAVLSSHTTGANDNGGGGGHTFNINVHAPNTGNAAQDRQTSLQQAADIRMAIAGAQKKGLI